MCISGTDMIKELYVLPHWDRGYRSKSLSTQTLGQPVLVLTLLQSGVWQGRHQGIFCLDWVDQEKQGLMPVSFTFEENTLPPSHLGTYQSESRGPEYFWLHSLRNSFGWNYQLSSSLCTHAFHLMDPKGPDIHAVNGWNMRSMHHPGRCYATVSMVGLKKKRSHTQKSHQTMVNPRGKAGITEEDKGEEEESGSDIVSAMLLM